MSPKVAAAREYVAYHMDKIVAQFKPGVNITVLVRTPGKPECDFMMTDDSLDEAIAMLERSKSREEIPADSQTGGRDGN